MMRFISFSSGSCGNCSLLVGPSSAIMIDAGVGIRSVKKNLEAVGLVLADISAILVTHDHGDHIRSLGSFCKRVGAPVWTTPVIHNALAYHPFTAGWTTALRHDLEPGVWNAITDDFSVQYFVVPHDATQCIGFAISCGDELVAFMTDLGHMTEEALHWASQAQTVVIESNYDMDMLLGGDYPEILKQRIRRGAGHLSNDDCAAAIARFIHPGLRNIFLCHLSGNNNTPELAYASASAALRDAQGAVVAAQGVATPGHGAAIPGQNAVMPGVTGHPIALRVLRRGTPSPLLNL